MLSVTMTLHFTEALLMLFHLWRYSSKMLKLTTCTFTSMQVFCQWRGNSSFRNHCRRYATHSYNIVLMLTTPIVLTLTTPTHPYPRSIGDARPMPDAVDVTEHVRGLDPRLHHGSPHQGQRSAGHHLGGGGPPCVAGDVGAEF